MDKITRRVLSLFEDIDFVGMRSELIGTIAVVYASNITFNNLFLEQSEHADIFLVITLVYTLFSWASLGKTEAIFNPAITITLAIFKRISYSKAFYYIMCQVLGSILAASLLKLLYPDTILNLTAESGYSGFPKFKSSQTGLLRLLLIFYLEFIGTFIVTLIYYIVIVHKRVKGHFQGIAIGSTYGVMAASFGIKTGAACNPARILGPALVGKEATLEGVYLLAHGTGAFLAAMVAEFILLRIDNIEKQENTNKNNKSFKELNVFAALKDIVNTSKNNKDESNSVVKEEQEEKAYYQEKVITKDEEIEQLDDISSEDEGYLV